MKRTIKATADWIGMEHTYLSRLKNAIPKAQRHLIFQIVDDVEAIIDSKHRVYRRVYEYLLASPIVHTQMFRNPPAKNKPNRHARLDFFDKVTSYWLGYNERPGDVDMYDLTAVGYKQLDPGFHPIKEISEEGGQIYERIL